MSKYATLKILKETLARTPKNCDSCGSTINPGEIYFRETLKDSHINFIGKKLCKACRMQNQINLLVITKGGD